MTPTWTDYLNAVEAAALDVKASLIDGRSPEMPSLSLPTGPPAPTEELRREQVAQLLDQVTEMLGQHRDAVCERLASLPRQRPRAHSYHAVSAGATVDVMG